MRRRPGLQSSGIVEAILCASALIFVVSCRGLPLSLSKPLPVEPQESDHQLQFACDIKLPDEQVVRQLERERDVIYSTLGLPPSQEKIYVNVYGSEETYHQILARKFPMVPNRRAFFVETDTRLEVYAHWSPRYAEDLRHEVAHGYLHAVVPAIPLWIDEGLAEYFEVPEGNGGLNHPHLLLLADMMEHNGWKPNLLELEALRDAGDMQQIHYAEAWAWAYFMIESTPERREILAEYLTELRDKGKARPLSARLKESHIQVERTLADYLVDLKSQQPIQKTAAR